MTLAVYVDPNPFNRETVEFMLRCTIKLEPIPLYLPAHNSS